MPNNYNIYLFIIQIIIIFILFLIIIWLLKLKKSISYEKRLSKYSVEALEDTDKSFFDKIENLYLKIRNNLSHILLKFKIFNNYSKKYEKYVDKSEIIAEDSINYISVKILSGIVCLLIVIFSDVLQYQNISLFQIFYSLVIGFFIPDIFYIARSKLRKKQIENDLLKAIIIMNNSFKSGRTTMQAISLVSEELDGAISDEFKKMYIDLTFGLDLEIVFKRFAKRVNIDEVKYITTSLTILNKTGGNIVKVFSSIERSFFNRRKLEHELKSITASANLIFKILICIPAFIFVAICLLNPTYFSPLISTKIGIVLLGIMLLIYIGYIVIVNKIMKVLGDM